MCKYISNFYIGTQAFPSQNCTTAHFPLHAHSRAPPSPPPPSIDFSLSSSPSGKPTTVSALQVRKANVRMPEPGPMGPMALVNGSVVFHIACVTVSNMFQ